MKIAVYGTLRKNKYNHWIMGNNSFLGITKTKPNFTMYDNGGFPFVYPVGTTEIVIEVYDVTDKRTLQRIYNLEGYSGKRGSKHNWYDTVDVETEWGIAEMFVSKSPLNLRVIESGNWKKKKL